MEQPGYDTSDFKSAGDFIKAFDKRIKGFSLSGINGFIIHAYPKVAWLFWGPKEFSLSKTWEIRKQTSSVVKIIWFPQKAGWEGTRQGIGTERAEDERKGEYVRPCPASLSRRQGDPVR